MKKYALNVAKPNNYMFIDKESGLFLSLSKRIGVVENSTPSLERAVRCNTIIDITEDKKTNKTTNDEKASKEKEENKIEQVEEKPKKTRKKKQEQE